MGPCEKKNKDTSVSSGPPAARTVITLLLDGENALVLFLEEFLGTENLWPDVHIKSITFSCACVTLSRGSSAHLYTFLFCLGFFFCSLFLDVDNPVIVLD